MEELIKSLNEEQKKELINALSTVDSILGDQTDCYEEYCKTDFYNELYKMMYYLGQWC